MNILFLMCPRSAQAPAYAAHKSKAPALHALPRALPRGYLMRFIPDADTGVGLMAWSNMIAILLLQSAALKTFHDYESQLKAGVRQPVFKPAALKIRNTKEWGD